MRFLQLRLWVWGWWVVASLGGGVAGAILGLLLMRSLVPAIVIALLGPAHFGLDLIRIAVTGIGLLCALMLGCYAGAGLAGGIGNIARVLDPAPHRFWLGWEVWCAYGGGCGTVIIWLIRILLE